MTLIARGVVREFRRRDGTVRVLDGVDLTVRSGRTVTIRGRSGSGKTTLLRLLGGLDVPDAGNVEFDGVALDRLSDRRLAALRRRRFGFVFQSCDLVPDLTVGENVALPLLLDGHGARSANERAALRLHETGLGDRARHLPDELSGGELHRAAVARALVADPDVLLADEPTGELDTRTAAATLDLIFGAAARGCAVVLVTHDDAAADRGEDRYCLDRGRLLPA